MPKDEREMTWRQLTRVLFSEQDRRTLRRAVSLLSFVSILEAVGVAAIYPFLNALVREASVLQPGRGTQSSFLANVSVTTAGVLLLTFFLVKNSLVAWNAFHMNRVIAGIRVRVTDRTFAHFIHEPFARHISRDLAMVQNSVQLNAAVLLGQATQQALLLISEVLVISMMLLVLLLLKPLATLIIIAASAAALAGWQMALRRRLTRYGEEVQQAQGRMIGAIRAGLRSFKEARVLGAEQHFADRVHDATSTFGRAEAFHQAIGELPRLIMEVMMIAAIVIGGLVAVGSGGLTVTDVATIGLFVTAGLRVIPSVNRIARATTSLQYCRPGLEDLAESLREPERVATSPSIPSEYSSVEASDVAMTYPGASRPALAGVSLRIRRGEVVSIVGPSGSGKTTLVDVLLGLLSPSSGSLRWLPSPNPSRERTICAYVPQVPYVETGTVRDNLSLGAHEQANGDDRYWSTLEAVGLADEVRARPGGLDYHVGEEGNRLSGGQRQRLALARSLARGAHLIILDEPTTGLDAEAASRVMDAWCNLGPDTTVVVVTHDPAVARRSDRTIRMDHGRLVDGLDPR